MPEKIGKVKLNILRMNSDKYNVFTMFANVYPVIFILIFLATVSAPVSLFSIRHNLSDCKQTFREYELESYVFI